MSTKKKVVKKTKPAGKQAKLQNLTGALKPKPLTFNLPSDGDDSSDIAKAKSIGVNNLSVYDLLHLLDFRVLNIYEVRDILGFNERFGTKKEEFVQDEPINTEPVNDEPEYKPTAEQVEGEEVTKDTEDNEKPKLAHFDGQA